MKERSEGIVSSVVAFAAIALFFISLLVGCGCTSAGPAKGCPTTVVAQDSFPPVHYKKCLYDFQKGCSVEEMERLALILKASQEAMCECFENVYGKRLKLILPEHGNVIPFEWIEIYPVPFPLSTDKEVLAELEVQFFSRGDSPASDEFWGVSPFALDAPISGQPRSLTPEDVEGMTKQPDMLRDNFQVARVQVSRAPDGMWDITQWGMLNHLMFRYWVFGTPDLQIIKTERQHQEFILASFLCIAPLLPGYEEPIERPEQPSKEDKWVSLDHMRKLPYINPPVG